MKLSDWASPESTTLLQIAASTLAQVGGDPLRAALALRSKASLYSAEQCSEALEIVVSRQKALKFGNWTSKGFFTRPSLEQATHPKIAARHAQRFANCRNVLEICTGAGFDTAALAKAADKVLSVESDPRLATMARMNLSVQDLSNVTVREGRAENILPELELEAFDGIWCDPSRRSADGRRITNPECYQPALSFLTNLPISGPRGIKLSPALRYTPPPDWSREWIGFGAECREQVLWHGTDSVDGLVTLVDEGLTWFPADCGIAAVEIVRNNTSLLADVPFLIEPHPALIRSSFLHCFYAERNFELLEEKIAYGLSNTKPKNSPFYKVFRIVSGFHYSLKSLRRELQALGWGSRSEIKKRGFPLEPDELRKALKLPKSNLFGTIILTRAGKRHLVFLAERI